MSPRTIRRGTVAAAAVFALGAWPAAADCTCRAGGRDYELGRTVCIASPTGLRLATCMMVLNNTSWRFSETPCVTANAALGGQAQSPPSAAPQRTTHAATGH
jgi:hypothetical protein